MKYKNLKSIAHNLGHSFFSLMNYTGADYVIERLYKRAKETKISSIKIDFLNQIIEPSEFNIVGVMNALKNYREYFPRDLESQNCSITQIKEVNIFLNFDLTKKRRSEYTDLELATYECIVEILDDRNITHKATVVEWWRYEKNSLNNN